MSPLPTGPPILLSRVSPPLNRTTYPVLAVVSTSVCVLCVCVCMCVCVCVRVCVCVCIVGICIGT